MQLVALLCHGQSRQVHTFARLAPSLQAAAMAEAAEDLRSVIENEVLVNSEPVSAAWLARESGHDLGACQQ